MTINNSHDELSNKNSIILRNNYQMTCRFLRLNTNVEAFIQNVH